MSESLNTTCEAGWQEHSSTLQASQLAYENLSVGWREKSSALQETQLANENLAAELQEKTIALQASQRANEDLTASLREESSALRSRQLAYDKLTAELQEKSSALQASQLAHEHLVAKFEENSSTLHSIKLANEKLTAELQVKCSDLRVSKVAKEARQASQLANKMLIAELAMFEEKISAPGLFTARNSLRYSVAYVSPPGPAKVDTAKVVVKTNPIIGAFKTSDVRSSQKTRQKVSKTISFANQYAKIPGLVVGLTAVDIFHDINIRVNAYPSEIRGDHFKINLDSWDDTKLHGAACAWLAIEADDVDFQYGSYHTSEDHSWPKAPLHNTRKITFKRKYTATPNVVVWLNVLDLGHVTNWRINSFATDVTATGFTIHIDTWDDTKLYSAVASWVAYPTNRPEVACGRFSTLDTRSPGQPQLYNSGFAAFETGVFEKPPRMFLALNSLDISCRQNMRLLVKAENVSATGMTWHLNAWSDTTLHSAGASFIAFR